jgi:hypothetical protein
MPIEHTWEERGYHKRYRGVVTGSDIADSVRAQVADPRFAAMQYAINEYEPGVTFVVSPEEITELERIETQYQYRQRGIVITYVTADPVLIDFLNSVYLESLMLIYPTVAEARGHLERILARPAASDPDGILDPTVFLGAAAPLWQPLQP